MRTNDRLHRGHTAPAHRVHRPHDTAAVLTQDRPSTTLHLVNMSDMFTSGYGTPDGPGDGPDPHRHSYRDPHEDDPGTDQDPTDERTEKGTALMFAEAMPLLDGPYCPCGALAEQLGELCRKCRSRNRWATRTAHRRQRGCRQ
jgi:hypothetical protein